MQFNDDTWSQIQLELGGHALQSAAWAAFQQRLGREMVREVGEGWSYQGFIMRSRGGVRYLYCPYGPTLGDRGAMEQVVESWAGLNVDFVRCEPVGGVSEAVLRRLGMRLVQEVQPRHTLMVDLTLDEEELRRGLSSGHRNAINGAERRGLSFRAGSEAGDLEHFLNLIHATAARTGFRPHGDEYFRAMLETLGPMGAAKLFVAEHEGRVVAAAISLDYAGTRAYLHAASDVEARKLQMAAPLVWRMMLDGKEAGMTAFDLWGIAPEGAPASHPWSGFTQFKRAFGGAQRDYVGTWELPVRPLRYRAYAFSKRLLR